MQLRGGSQRPCLATEYFELHFQRSQLTHYNGIKCENIYWQGQQNDTGEASKPGRIALHSATLQTYLNYSEFISISYRSILGPNLCPNQSNVLYILLFYATVDCALWVCNFTIIVCELDIPKVYDLVFWLVGVRPSTLQPATFHQKLAYHPTTHN